MISNNGSSRITRGQLEAVAENEIAFSIPADLIDHFSGGVRVTVDDVPIATLALEHFEIGSYVRQGERRLEYRFRLPDALIGRKPRRRVNIIRIADGQQLSGGNIYPKISGRKPRILVLIPAGARWKHSSVELYQQPWSDLIGRYFNVGDMMVYDSTLKVLDYEYLDVARITDITDDLVSRYNSDFDYCFLRGSNYIHEAMHWENARSLLERLRLPIYAIGVGAQAETARRLNLSEESKTIWKMISERCGSIGVRGEFTAYALADIGIYNVDIVGCPSLFRGLNRDLKLQTKPVRDIEHVAFSLRREVSAHYSSDPRRYIELQRQALLNLNRDCRKLTVTIHGEPEEKSFFFRDSEAQQGAIQRLRAADWLVPDSERDILQIYKEKLFMYVRADDYDDFIKSVDFALGYRVHGVLPALANGISAALVDYDVRSAELAHTHNIPLISEKDAGTKTWRDIYEKLNFTRFQDSYVHGYDRLKDFLSRNGISNNM